MTAILRGEADAIRLEPPGAEGEGVEFWLRRPATIEFHQVKRQKTGHGRWTLAALAREGVLQNFYARLNDPQVVCVFVSAHAADELDELISRAGDAADIAEFTSKFLTGNWGAKFGQLRSHWNDCTDLDAFSRLRRVRVHTIDERLLRTSIELGLSLTVEGDPRTASDVLFAFAFDSIHQELDAGRIWSHLASHCIRRNVWNDPTTISELVAAANSGYCNRIRESLIQNRLVTRTTVQEIVDALLNPDDHRGVFLVGAAGYGKSSVLLGVVESLRESGVPVLAMRIDRLEPTTRPSEIGAQLGLPTSPVAVLAALAKGKPSVLIIDQLDAVSLTSGRHPEFFDCFAELAAEAVTVPSMRLLVACRDVDYRNDHRLRSLGGANAKLKTIELKPFTIDVVKQIVKEIGIDPASLVVRQIELLSVPAHLSLFVESTGDGQTASLDFNTVNDLYERFWTRKQHTIRNRLGHNVSCNPAIRRLADYLSKHQTLSAPNAILDDYFVERDALLSEHVLVQDGPRIAFFHEGFFDFVFARDFVGNGGDLLSLMRSTEQHLFRRAQVRQILAHARDANRPRYLIWLSELLAADDIRFHIKRATLDLLGGLPNPSKEEWEIVNAALEHGKPGLSNAVWFVLRNGPWFRLLNSQGVLYSWLRHPDEARINDTNWLLLTNQQELPDDVAELIEPFIGVSDVWSQRIRRLFGMARLSGSRRYFDLFLKFVDRGDLDDPDNLGATGLFGLLRELVEKRPEWACEALGCYFNRRLKITVAAGETDPFETRIGNAGGMGDEEMVLKAAQGSPRLFVQQILPFVLEVVRLNLELEGNPPRDDSIWRWRHDDPGHDLQRAVLYSTELALRHLAEHEPDEFVGLAKSLRDANAETAIFLLMRGYTANGRRFADDAVELVCTSPIGLKCGYLDSADGASQDLIAAAAPHCSPKMLEMLEARLLSYYPPYERLAEGRAWSGMAQFGLLSAIPVKRQSPAVQGRIGELQRKFSKPWGRDRLRTQAHVIGSPISADRAGHMSDDNWIRAMTAYPHKDKVHERGTRFVGDATELAYVLEAIVRSEPERFANLAHRIPQNGNYVYFAAILRGLCDPKVQDAILFDVARLCHTVAKQRCARTICSAIEGSPTRPWPQDLLDAIGEYATRSPDPVVKSTDDELAQVGDGHLETAGLNSTRGGAADAIRALLFADRTRLDSLRPALSVMVSDPSIAVRALVASALLPLLNYDRAFAVELFLRLCDTHEALLKTRFIGEFLRYATATHFNQLKSVIERMFASADPDVAQAGARQACLAALGIPEAQALLECCRNGTEPLRLGTAVVFAANLDQANLRHTCEEGLAASFNDPSENVREAAAQCFRQLEDNSLGAFTQTIRSFISSRAFPKHHRELLQALQRMPARLPDVTIDVCENFLRDADPKLGDIRTSEAFDSHSISTLLIRAYQQSENATHQSRCLDLIDRMFMIGAFGMHEAVSECDR